MTFLLIWVIHTFCGLEILKIYSIYHYGPEIYEIYQKNSYDPEIMGLYKKKCEYLIL